MQFSYSEDRYLESPPPPTSEATSKSMKANKSKNTKPELMLRRALRDRGLVGYRLNWKNAPGRPDISYPGKKLAFFVHGCFWHRCPHCKPSLPKSHTEFWKHKFEMNQKRDREKRRELEENGWTVLEFWECEIKEDVKRCAGIVVDCYRKIISGIN